MGCCCSLPTPATSEAADALLAGYDAGAQFSVARVDSDEHALWEGAVDALAQAFCGTESKASFPPFGWIYSGETETGPLPAAPTPERAAWFKWYLALCAHVCLNRGGLYALVDDASGKVVSAAGVVPPGAPSASIGGWEFMQITGKPQMKQLGGATGPAAPGWGGRDGTLDKAMAEASSSLAPGDHLHVLLFGTCPESQGTGAGSALLNFVTALADADGVPAYLESGGDSPGFFAAKGGFEEVRRVALVDKKSTSYEAGGGMCCMLRKKQSFA